MMRTGIPNQLPGNSLEGLVTDTPIARTPNSPQTLKQYKALAASKPVQESTKAYNPTNEDKLSLEKSREFCNANEIPLRDGIVQFSKILGSIHENSSKISPKYKPEKKINYVDRLQRHVQAVIEDKGTISHDMNIVVSQTLSAIHNKLSRHPDDQHHPEIAKQIITALYEAFPTYLEASHTYKNVLPPLTHANPKEKAVNNVLTGLINGINRQKLPIPVNNPSLTNTYLASGQLCISSEKPKFNPYEPSGRWVDHHSHGFNNYDPRQIANGRRGMEWTIRQGERHGVNVSTVMAIPHRIILDEDKINDHIKYYTDRDVGQCCHHGCDKQLLDTVNQQAPAQRGKIIPTATGTNLMGTSEELRAKTRDDAASFAYVVTKAKLATGQKEILVMFGELTGNKPSVPQEMLGTSSDSYVDNVAAVLKEIFNGAKEGMAKALNEALEAKQVEPGAFKGQIRIVFHNDTEAEGVKTGHPNIKSGAQILQPTIQSVLDYTKSVNSALEEKASNENKTTTITNGSTLEYEHVLQVAHLLGVTPSNFNKTEAGRTKEIYNFFSEARKLETLRVVTDTSWLTAAARYANFGMGNFLQKSNDKDIQEIGKRLITADNMANDGFMFFSAGERHFQDRVLAGDNSLETIQGLALMRSALEKTFQSYYQEIGGIHAAISDSKNGLGGRLVEYIKTDANKNGEAPSEGNFIGLMYKLYNEHQNKNNAHDAVPFVWGSDGLTQFGVRSGAEQNKIYRDQVTVGALMEMSIEWLIKHGHEDDAIILSSMLTSMRQGSERDRPFLESKPDITYDTEKMPEDSRYFEPTEKDIQAANRLVMLGNRESVRSAWSTEKLIARANTTPSKKSRLE